MFGVVLWSDSDENQAVIWCEDHGDLAFCRNRDLCGELTLDAGDWVQFDLATDQQHRYAHNPRLIAEGLYPDLADKLNSVVQEPGCPVQADDEPAADILPFSRVGHGATRTARADCV